MDRSASLSFTRRSISARSIVKARSSFSTPRRENTRTSTTVPWTPGGNLKEVSRTSDDFSPKIARKSFSSGVEGVSPLGVTFPTRISPGFTSAPIYTIPASSKWRSASSPILGISRVISSLPSFVSRARTSNSSIWIEVKISFLTIRSEIMMESSKL